MSSHGNRTFICSVTFIDIVEYSKKSVTEQMRVKERLNALLAQALADVPEKDRIILDTGDGAAISFLGDPDEALFLGLALRDARAGDDAALRLRVGINLGPVRLVKDINGQPNIIGDGINVAQRVMDFAATNQILASRSYYEVVSALSPDYAQLFRSEGSRTDKHVREHEIYALGDAPAPQRAPRAKHRSAASGATAALEKLGSAAEALHVRLMRRPPLATALAVLLILGLAFALRLAVRGKTAAPPETAAIAQTAPQPAPLPATPAPTIEKPRPKPAAEPLPDPAPPPKAKSAKKPAETARPRESSTTPVATGSLRVTIVPWGEIHINDSPYGVAPPLRDIALKPGRYRIEVRNPGFASYVQVVDVQSGEEIRIRHRFR